ncbi:MAG: DMT family transporter [Blastocatellia bacterium]
MTIASREFVAWLTLCVTWGTTWMFLKVGLRDVTPLTYSGARMTLTFAVLAPMLWGRREARPRTASQWRFVALLGLFQIAVPFALNAWAIRFVPSSLVAILFSVHPLFVIVLAHFLIPGEHMRARTLAGAVCGIAGVTAICWQQLGLGRANALSVMAMIASALSSAVANIIAKRRQEQIDAIVNTAYQTLLGGLMLLALAFVWEQPLATHFTPRSLGALAYLVTVGSGLGFTLFYWLIKRVEVTLVSFTVIINTLIATLLGWLVMDERLGWHTLAGGALILTGTLLVITQRRSGMEKK